MKVSDKNVQKDVLNAINSKTGKKVTEKDISKLASGVKPSTLQSEEQLRQLIKQVSGMVNIPVSESTVNDIIQAVKGSNLNTGSLEQLMKMMASKKK
ncbi:stage VI sporulation protein F [Paenibacillus aurantius]|uniref:Stage VI sporulation protein F n=1 Tax=Paenibacillus aurantius TaxID=2918900 RepID=A0AA96RFS0_9BACL|nr:stage VI sporulation protein F [Paenibacillus aurantius]WNQ09299.1 stage VI sporulation protein F [Paenibacillus aurantius]